MFMLFGFLTIIKQFRFFFLEINMSDFQNDWINLDERVFGNYLSKICLNK